MKVEIYLSVCVPVTTETITEILATLAAQSNEALETQSNEIYVFHRLSRAHGHWLQVSIDNVFVILKEGFTRNLS